MQTILDRVRPVGFLKRYKWRVLEPVLGAYDLAELRSDQQFCAKRGVQLLPMIEDKTFRLELPLPDYLGLHCLPNQTGGYTAVRWHPYVVERYKALVAKLGCDYAIQETALGYTTEQLAATGYSAQALVAAYSDIIRSSPHKAYLHFNYLTGGQTRIPEVVKGLKNVAAGGPDTWPTNDGLTRLAYPLYPKMGCPLFLGMSIPSYDQVGYTIRQTYEFALALGVEQVFWVYHKPVFDEVVAIIKGES